VCVTAALGQRKGDIYGVSAGYGWGGPPLPRLSPWMSSDLLPMYGVATQINFMMYFSSVFFLLEFCSQSLQCGQIYSPDFVSSMV